MARLIAQFEQEAANVDSLPALQSLVEAVAGEIGFAYVGLVQRVSFHKSQSTLVHLDNYPDAWRAEFVEGGLFRDDPVLQFSQRTGKTFAWDTIGSRMILERRHQYVLDRSGRFGLGPGVTVPCNIHGEPSASCSFAVRAGRSLPRGSIRIVELIGIDALDATRRLQGLTAPRLVPHLSRRQLQVLRLMGAGKTDWEISVILGISFETVRAYGKSLRAAYNVITRTQLIAHALHDGQITYDDAIAPFG